MSRILRVDNVIGHPEAIRSLVGAGLKPHDVEDGDKFTAGGLEFQVIHTPGHTTGSCCFLTGSVCCVGDTLFAGSVGGVDGGPAVYQTLLQSDQIEAAQLAARNRSVARPWPSDHRAGGTGAQPVLLSRAIALGSKTLPSRAPSPVVSRPARRIGPSARRAPACSPRMRTTPGLPDPDLQALQGLLSCIMTRSSSVESRASSRKERACSP